MDGRFAPLRPFRTFVASILTASVSVAATGEPITLFLAGDVMTGRGIDQILATPSAPMLHEPAVADARTYVELAERAGGRLPRRVGAAYVWGDLADELETRRPDLRVFNLETTITTSEEFWPGKAVHYRMHPGNVNCLSSIRPDLYVLANNHVLDWGPRGLDETLAALRGAGLAFAGAGRNAREAAAPVVLTVPGKGRVVVLALGSPTSGIPREWAATDRRSGVNLLEDLSNQAVQRVAEQVRAAARPQDLVVVSIHWGGNWGYDVSEPMRRFAHGLIDHADVDVIHGHSSHHPLPVEVYRGRPILYGCGDLLNDYEGIGGRESYRPDLALAYFLDIDPATGQMSALRMVPLQIRGFRLNRAGARDAAWLAETLTREGRRYGTRVELQPDGTHRLVWRR